MHVNTFDRYVQGHSLVHRLDPRAKVCAAFFFILSSVLLPDGSWPAFLVAWLFLFGVSLLAHIPYTLVFKRSLIIVPFLMAAVTVLLNTPGTAVVTAEWGPLPLVITDSGLVRFGSILIRGWLAVQMAILLTAATPFPDILHALTHLRVPALLISIISFMYRYLFVLADEAGRLLRARQARSARLPDSGRQGGSVWWRARVAGHMVGQLFARSLDRSDRVYQAMLARGYNGRFLTIHHHEMHTRDWAVMSLALVLTCLIQLLARVGS